MALCLLGSVVQEPVRRWPYVRPTAREARRAGAQGEHGLLGQFLSGYLTMLLPVGFLVSYPPDQDFSQSMTCVLILFLGLLEGQFVEV